MEDCLTSTRYLAAYYFWYFAAIGVLEPYLTLYYRHLGFSGAQIGFLSALAAGALAVGPAIWTAWADAVGRQQAVFAWNTWVAGILLLLVPAFPAFLPLVLVVGLFSFVRSPLIPLANAMVLHALGPRPEGFGRVRLWGSVGYIAAAVLVGWLIDRAGARLGILAGALALFACGGMVRGRAGQAAMALPAWREFRALFTNGNFVGFLGATFLARVSSGTYTTFFTIHLETLGISKAVAGLAWALGVASEVAIMASWRRIATRGSLRTLLAVGLTAHALRWYLYTTTAREAGILGIQLLHGLTFGLFYLAAVQFVDETTPSPLRATGQGIFAAATFGLGGIIGNLLSGGLYDAVGMVVLYRLSAGIALGAAGLFLASVRRPRAVPAG